MNMTDRQTHRKTDATERITAAAIAGGKNPFATFCRY